MGQTKWIPWGYRLCDGMIVIDEDIAPVIRIVFQKVNEQIPINQICRDIERTGLKNRQGNVKWQPRKIRDILNEEAYCGKNGYHAIIDEVLFQSVQEVRKKKVYKKPDKRDEDMMTGGRYVYCNMILCGDCGSEFKRNSKGRRYRVDGQLDGSVYWYCPVCKVQRSGQGQAYIKITDEQIRQIYGKVINQMLVCPAVYKNAEECNLVLDNDLTRELEERLETLDLQNDGDIRMALQTCFQLAKERFRLLKTEGAKEKTEHIARCLSRLEYPVTTFDKRVFCEIVKEIRIKQEGDARVTFTNGMGMPIL